MRRWLALLAVPALIVGWLSFRRPSELPQAVEVEVRPRSRARVVAAAAHADDEYPHPITSQHEHIQQQLALIGQLNDALDQRDAASLRTLIERYELDDPEDTQRLAEGYERIADCIESSPGARVNAQRYYEEARASSLRRYIRRVCFEEATL